MIKLFAESMLVLTMLSSITMAIDVHSPGVIKKQTTPANVQDKDKESSATEAEPICKRATVVSNGGVTLCAYLNSGRSGTTASFSVSDDTHVRRTPFLQIIN